MSIFAVTILFPILLGLFGYEVVSLAGVFIDEFDKPKLNEDVWVPKPGGKGDYKIKDGKLILSAPQVADGIMFYYKNEIKKEEMIIEAKIDVSGIANDGGVGFTDEIIPAQLNTEVHKHLHAQYVILTTGWGVNADNRTKGGGQRLFDGNYAGAEHVFTIELKGNKMIFSVDGKVGGEAPREADSRYYFVSPDQYTSHYTGTIAVDYIKLSGDTISAAVQYSGKIATTWGRIK
jgi:hypothetical protein